MGSAEAQDRKSYYCLTCQRPRGMRQIRTGVCRGHLMTEFECHDEATVDTAALMRGFREKVEAAKRYIQLRYRAGL